MTLLKLQPQPFLTALVGLAPEKARHIAPDLALQRLHFASGRTITESAIETEQAWAEARLGMAGRRLSWGVVAGLRVGVPDQADVAGAFTLSAGRGIAPGGQDVAVLKPAALNLSQIPELGSGGEVAGTARGFVVLVLEPAVIETEKLPQDGSARLAFEDPCPPDATTAPYLDFVLQDAARLAWVALEDDIGGADDARAANVAAEAIRRREVADPESLPWTNGGVPICLLRVDDAGRILWHHHGAVARKGGMLPRGGRGQGDRLRQSRLEGLIEETAAATRRGWTGTGAADFLKTLPPAGVLPRKCWDQPGFFPAGWAVAQAPIPVSQLDAALEAARRLAPFDLDVARDRVKFLVPVPDEHYAADLLEPIAEPKFDAVSALLEQAVGDRLALRNAYRAQARSVQGALDFSAVTDFAQAEDDPIPGESTFPAIAPEPDPFDVDARAALTRVHARLPPNLFTEAQLAMVDPARLAGALDPLEDRFGLTPFVSDMRGLIDAANDTIDFSFNRVQAEIYRLRQIVLDEEEATKLATFPVLAGLAKGSNAFAMAEGLKANFLAKKTDDQAPPTREGGGEFIPLSFDARAFGGFAANIAAPDPIAETIAPIKLGSVDLQGSTMLSGLGLGGTTMAFGSNLADAARIEDAGTTIVKNIVDSTRAGLVDDAILSNTAAKRSGILRAAPLPGDIRDVRNASIADRLKASAALTAKSSAVRIKADVLQALQGMGLSLEGLTAPLTSGRDRVLLPKGTIDRVLSKTLTPAELDEFNDTIERLRSPVAETGDENWELMQLPAAQAQGGDSGIALTPLTRMSAALLVETAPFTLSILPALTLTKALDPDPGGKGSDPDLDDEAAYLDSAVGVLEGVIALLRRVEGRVLAISGAVDVAATALPTLDKLQHDWQQALTAADQNLDEARHDVRVGRSLMAAERARLKALARRRQQILDEEVQFVAYTRPRALRPHSAGDTLGQRLPGKFEDPLPAALKRSVKLPPALAAMIEVLREMPILWFSADPELVASFDDPEFLWQTMTQAGPRAEAAKAGRAAQTEPSWMSAATPSWKTAVQSVSMQQVGQVTMAYQAMMWQLHDARLAIDMAAVKGKSWKDKRREALALLSLNDLIANGSQPKVARLAAIEVEQIERVIHALSQQARQVAAPIRLLWVQRLSEFDTVGSLRSLATLPGWALIPFDARQRLDRLNGWLFSRMDAGLDVAEGFMSDLVRVALLISAHAPVAEIVSARVDEVQTALKGGPVDIVIRRGKPKIGMQVSFLESGAAMAWGHIADLSGDRARVEIVETVQPLVQIGLAQSVAIYDPGSLAWAP